MMHAVMNHLWQSTLFAVAAGLLTLALRKNGAHTRYWLWCAASWKFLIPFSVLSTVGSYLSWRSTPTAPVPLRLEQLVQPFSPAAIAAPVMPTGPVHSPGIQPLMIWMSVWACGTIAVGIYWMVRWLQIRAAVRDSTALPLDAPIPVRSSRTLIEPGVVGLFRPVLLLPDGICERLTSEQLQTILTHELSHVRRRDNLTASIHMLVEALFWFHPLVWWMGRRLIVEREGACDEAVIATGGDREAYAEALLTVCKFYVMSPIAAAAGVAGADLKKRIELIMTPRITHKLSAASKALLAAAATAAALVPIAIGSVLATPYRAAAQTEGGASGTFQSVTIQESQSGSPNISILVGPDSFRTQNYSLRELIAWAFDVQGALISGPDTLDAKYNIEANAPSAFPRSGNEAVDAARAMVRNMLADQFQLETHRGTQSISAYVLTAAGAGANFQVSRPGEPGPRVQVGPTSITGSVLRMSEFVELLSQRLGHAVLDQTGLTQTYDFQLDWRSDTSPAAEPAEKAPAVPPIPSPEVLASALQTQLGMVLKLEQSPAEVLVVDRVQSPKDLVAPREAVAMDPKLFDAYVGHYLMLGGMVMTVSRDNEHFWTQLPGQPPVEIFPEGNGNFFAKVVDAQISFLTDAQRQVSGLELHQNGQNVPAPRMDEATAKQMADALNAKVQQQTAAPGSDQALRQLIAELASGKPDYDRMSFELAEATREQLPTLHPWLASLGSLVSLKFTSVDPQGGDTYEARFEHGALECHISMTPDGKIASALVRPAP
jgi:bla regulator protein blaR1